MLNQQNLPFRQEVSQWQKRPLMLLLGNHHFGCMQSRAREEIAIAARNMSYAAASKGFGWSRSPLKLSQICFSGVVQ